MGRLRLLLLEDRAADAELTLRALARAKIEVDPTHVANREAFERALAAGGFDLILADYDLPNYSGLDALEHVRARDALIPFLLVSGTIGEERAVDALHAGATDCVLKTSLSRLAPAVRRALEERAARERHLATQRALAASEERQRELTRRLLEVQEAERRHLARELHDEVGQALTALKIQLETLARASRGRAAQGQLEEGARTTALALEQIRRLAFSLRPSQLDDLGLEAALRAHLDSQARIGGLVPHFDVDGAARSLAPEVETACFRVAQEAITNVLRHARARNVWLRLSREGDRVALSVRDDGEGFEPETARRRAAARGSLGLAGMEERVALAGGALELRSGPGQGSSLVASFPSARPAPGPPA